MICLGIDVGEIGIELQLRRGGGSRCVVLIGCDGAVREATCVSHISGGPNVIVFCTRCL